MAQDANDTNSQGGKGTSSPMDAQPPVPRALPLAPLLGCYAVPAAAIIAAGSSCHTGPRPRSQGAAKGSSGQLPGQPLSVQLGVCKSRVTMTGVWI